MEVNKNLNEDRFKLDVPIIIEGRNIPAITGCFSLG
jgi:hypothetical protein